MTNPYAPPTQHGVGTGLLRFVDSAQLPESPELGTVLIEPKGGKDIAAVPWRMMLGRDELWLAPPNGPAVALTHQEFAEHVNLMVAGSSCVLGLKGLGSVTAFQAPRRSLDPLADWMALRGDLHVSAALKKRLRFAVPVGIMVAVTSLPIAATNVSWLGAAFGVSLVLLAIIARLKPHPVLFIGLGLNWFLLAASNVQSILNGTRWIIPFTIMSLIFGYGALSNYGFYRRIGSSTRAQPPS